MQPSLCYLVGLNRSGELRGQEHVRLPRGVAEVDVDEAVGVGDVEGVVHVKAGVVGVLVVVLLGQGCRI